MNTKNMKRRAFIKGVSELIKPDISLRRRGNCLMLLKGRITRKALIPFTEMLGKFVISVNPEKTTMKSSQFHPSLK